MNYINSINIICFTITSLINKGPDLEIATGYMELSWMIGLTIDSIFYSIGGYSLPYYICTLICLFGIYAFYQVGQIEENFNNPEQLELMKQVNINSENKNDDYNNNKSVILIIIIIKV